MSSTLNPACSLCGLRFGNKPLLDLHIREDHRQHFFHAQNGDRDHGSARAPASGADSPPDPHDPAATPSWTSKKATARPARRGRRAGRAETVLRYVNGELRRAPGTVMRFARTPQPRPHAPVPPGEKPRKAQRRAAAERADRDDCPICQASFPL